MRFEMIGQAPSRASPDQLAPIDILSVFDGDMYKYILTKPADKPQGSLERGKNLILDADMGVHPILWNLRPLEMGLSLENWTVGPDITEKDRGPFVFVTNSAVKRPRNYRLDPSRNYAIVQLKTPGEQVDIILIQDKDIGWLPSAWTSIMPRGHEEFTTVACKVIEYSINGKIDDAQFQLEFPVGTVVTVSKDESMSEKSLKTPARSKRIAWLTIATVGLLAFFILLRVFNGRSRKIP